MKTLKKGLFKNTMGKVRKERFLYMYTGELENHEVQKLIRDGIKDYDPDRKYELIINVLEKKDGEKRGYSFGWISDTGLFYALVGKNEDGSSRVTYEDDPDWSEPEDSEPLTLGTGMNWGDSVWDECPKIRVEKPPLITVSPYMGKDGEEHTVDFFETTCDDVFTDRESGKTYMLKNEIYSLRIPECVTEAFLMKTFKRFTCDRKEHKVEVKKKKGEKGKKKYITVTYPQIKINVNQKGDRNCQIIFSPLDKDLAQFALTMHKILRYGKKNHEKIYFSQSKRS